MSQEEYAVETLVELPDDNKAIREDPVLPDKRDAEWYARQERRYGMKAWVEPVEVSDV